MKIKTKVVPLTTTLIMIGLLTGGAVAQTFDWVSVGNTNNVADASTGLGFVNYEYNISKHEVTNSQYTAFLNAKGASDPGGFGGGNLYNNFMGTNSTIDGINRSGSLGSYSYSVTSGSENNPVAYVNWFDAARYTNWLHNGMGSGDTESGVYDLSATGAARFNRSVDAKFWIPTADEWYKAAFYDPTKGGSGGYWKYATQVDADASIGNTTANIAPNAFTGIEVTDVNAYSAHASFYGTLNQSGNVFEWVAQTTDGGDVFARGGGWAFGKDEAEKAGFEQYTLAPTAGETDHTGFRLASAVPEPSSALLCSLGGFALLLRRRK